MNKAFYLMLPSMALMMGCGSSIDPTTDDISQQAAACEEPPPPPDAAPPPMLESCETAFAYGSSKAICLIGMQTGRSTVNRWGWTNGALAEGNYWFDIYAAAGQCDLSKGTNVGTLTIDYHGGTANICYHASGGVTLNETHLYVGSQPLPTNKMGDFTVAPGLFPYSGSSDGCYEVTGLSGRIYVIAHAEVCPSSKYEMPTAPLPH